MIAPARIRLAEVLTSLALAIDLGLGLPMRTLLRTTLVAERLARAAGLDEADVAAVYYLAILRYVGCTTTSHEVSQFVDELALAGLLVVTDEEMMPELMRMMRAVLGECPRRSASKYFQEGRSVAGTRKVSRVSKPARNVNGMLPSTRVDKPTRTPARHQP